VLEALPRDVLESALEGVGPEHGVAPAADLHQGAVAVAPGQVEHTGITRVVRVAALQAAVKAFGTHAAVRAQHVPVLRVILRQALEPPAGCAGQPQPQHAAPVTQCLEGDDVLELVGDDLAQPVPVLGEMEHVVVLVHPHGHVAREGESVDDLVRVRDGKLGAVSWLDTQLAGHRPPGLLGHGRTVAGRGLQPLRVVHTEVGALQRVPAQLPVVLAREQVEQRRRRTASTQQQQDQQHAGGTHPADH
jgi:hypothetical protein